MGNRILVVLGVVGLVLATAAGAFYGGMQFERQQATNIRANFFAQRGGDPSGGAAGGFFGNGGAGAPGAAAGRGALGEIKSLEGNTLTLSTPQSEVKVTLTDTTLIQKLVAGERGDLQVGARVTVRGERDSAGNLTADGIQITANAPGQ